nr:hypothetical protein [Sagittula salina]
MLAAQLFNAGSVADLAAGFAALPGFDAERFLSACVPGLEGRGLMQRLDWVADCLEAQLPSGFPAMAEALEAAMPEPLDPALRDNDFGRFIHAVFGVLAVRHGMAAPERALDLLHAATRRFSMEYAVRPFLNRWPDMTLTRMRDWMHDENYHVRRLVSEGTRPRLPWGRAVTIDPTVPLGFLDRLHRDEARFVTRSVANHMNDLSRVMPEAVTERLARWRDAGQQDAAEMAWITRHALRTAVKRGEPRALALLGFEAGGVTARLEVLTPKVRVGEALRFAVWLEAEAARPAMVDYRLRFFRPGGAAEKVFKLKACEVGRAGLRLEKRHVLKGDATTYRLHPGLHGLVVQVNGVDLAEAAFDLIAE